MGGLREAAQPSLQYLEYNMIGVDYLGVVARETDRWSKCQGYRCQWPVFQGTRSEAIPSADNNARPSAGCNLIRPELAASVPWREGRRRAGRDPVPNADLDPQGCRWG